MGQNIWRIFSYPATEGYSGYMPCINSLHYESVSTYVATQGISGLAENYTGCWSCPLITDLAAMPLKSKVEIKLK